MEDNALDFELAKSVGKYFRLSENEMENILSDVWSVVKDWKQVAVEIGIKNREVEIMGAAFRC
jgi:serine/threonine-protein kinase HipA